MLLGQFQDILLAHQRFAAGPHVQVHTQLFAFRDDLIHILKAEVVLVAVLAGPAAHAMHVAGRGGVEQDQPGNVALVLYAVLADHLGASEESFVAQIQRRGAGHVVVQLVQCAVDEPRPFAGRIGQGLFGVLIGLVAECAAVELFGQIHQLANGLFGVFICTGKYHVHHLADGSALHFMRQVFH